MNPEEIAKKGTKTPGSGTAIISLAMVIASIGMLFLVGKEQEMRMVPDSKISDPMAWGPWLALAAIVFSFISIIYSSTKKGKIRYGIIGLFSFIMGILMIIFSGIFYNWEKPRRTSCAGNLKQIGLGILMYSQENNNQFPDKNGASGLEMLRSGGYLKNVIMYKCYSTKWEAGNVPYVKEFSEKYNCMVERPLKLTEETIDYVYVGGYNKNTPPDTIIAYDKTNNHYKFRNVLFADGHVAGYSGANWMNDSKK